MHSVTPSLFSCMDVFHTKTFIGGIQQLCGHNFAVFYPAWTVFYPEHEQQQTFFDPLPHQKLRHMFKIRHFLHMKKFENYIKKNNMYMGLQDGGF